MKTLNNFFSRITLVVGLSFLLAGFLPTYGQGFTLEPAKGDRASYYLVNSQWGEGGLVWESDFDYSSPIILKSFRNTETESYWIQKLNMKTGEFEKLKKYLEKNNIGIGGITREAERGSNNYQLSAFDIYFEDINKTKDTIKNFFIKRGKNSR